MLAALLYFGIVLPVRNGFAESEAKIQQQADLLARYRSVAGHAQEIAALKTKLGAQGTAEEFLIGSNEGVVNASLQAQLKAIAEKSGAQLRSIRALPPRLIGSTNFTGARMEVAGPLQAIQACAYWVESDNPTMIISSAIVRDAQGAAADQNSLIEPLIESQLDIYAPAQFRVVQ